MWALTGQSGEDQIALPQSSDTVDINYLHARLMPKADITDAMSVVYARRRAAQVLATSRPRGAVNITTGWLAGSDRACSTVALGIQQDLFACAALRVGKYSSDRKLADPAMRKADDLLRYALLTVLSIHLITVLTCSAVAPYSKLMQAARSVVSK